MEKKKGCNYNLLIGIMCCVLAPFQFLSGSFVLTLLLLLIGIFAFLSLKIKSKLPVIILSSITLCYSLVAILVLSIGLLFITKALSARIGNVYNFNDPYYYIIKLNEQARIPDFRDVRLQYCILSIGLDFVPFKYLPITCLSFIILLANIFKCKVGRIISSIISLIFIIMVSIPATRAFSLIFSTYTSINHNYQLPILEFISRFMSNSMHGVYQAHYFFLYLKLIFNLLTHDIIISIITLLFAGYLSFNIIKKIKHCHHKENNNIEETIVEEKIEA